MIYSCGLGVGGQQRRSGIMYQRDNGEQRSWRFWRIVIGRRARRHGVAAIALA